MAWYPGLRRERPPEVVESIILRPVAFARVHWRRTWAEIGALVGQRSLKVTSDTYTHVLVDGRELDYAAMLSLR